MFKNKTVVVLFSLVGFMLLAYLGVYIYSTVIRSSILGEIPRGEYAVGSTVDGEDSGAEIADEAVAKLSGERKIQTGTLEIEVEDLEESRDDVSALADKYDGSVSYLYESGTGNERSVSVTLRVPVAEFDNVIEDVRGLAKEVSNVYVNSDDVTQEYVDVAARLKNEKAYEKELVALLNEAESVEDVLAVRVELNTVRANVESLQAELDYYTRNTDYSTITVSLSLFDTGVALSDEPWAPLGVARVALSNLVTTLTALADLLIWVVVFSPLVLVPYGVFWLVRRRKK